MDRDWTASFSIRFRNGTCIIILDKKYNIANSSCHFGPYDPQCHELFAIWSYDENKHYGDGPLGSVISYNKLDQKNTGVAPLSFCNDHTEKKYPFKTF